MELSRQSLSELPKGPFTATKLWNEIVSQMKLHLQVKRRRWRMKQYDDVFVSSEAVDWLHDYLKGNPNFGPTVNRQQAIQLCQKFLSHNIIEDARGKDFNSAVFEDNSHLYRFVNIRNSPFKRGKTSPTTILDHEKIQFSQTYSSDSTSSFYSSKVLRRKSSSHSLSKTPFSEAPTRTPLGGLTNKMNVLGSVKSDSKMRNGEVKKRAMKRDNEGSIIMNPTALGFQTNRRSLTEKEINEIWWNITISRLSSLLEVKFSPDDIKGDDYDIECVRENAEQEGICKASEVVPGWLLSAMKCLVQWPLDNGNTRASFPKYPGFERDVFRAVAEHFDSSSEPLVHSNILPLFIKTAGVIARCKATALRSLQYCCMMMQPSKRKTLQVLVKLMMRLAENINLVLSDELPTKERVIQTFSRCTFGRNGDMDVIRLLYFMIENFPVCFLKPEGLQFQVEQRVVFLQNGRGKTCALPRQNARTFCEHVTTKEYEEEGMRSSQNALKDLLNQIVTDNSMSEKQRKKKFKQFEKSHPDIYFAKFPSDNISTASSRRKSERLRNIMKPLGVLKNFR